MVVPALPLPRTHTRLPWFPFPTNRPSLPIQYCNFVSLEEDLFALSDESRDDLSYYALNNPVRCHLSRPPLLLPFGRRSPLTFPQRQQQEAEDEAIEATIDAAVEGLFCACVTMDIVPIIRCSPKCAALPRPLPSHPGGRHWLNLVSCVLPSATPPP